MKTIFGVLIPLIVIFVSQAHAANLCVGLATTKYCLGKPLPYKADSYEITTLDGGIDIQTRKNSSIHYDYGEELDGASGLFLETTLVTQNGKVTSVYQSYRIDANDHQAKERVYSLLEKKMSRQYGKPTARSMLYKSKYAEWVNKTIDIYITDIFEEHVTVSFTIPSRR